jgi:hypothetical protein
MEAGSKGEATVKRYFGILLLLALVLSACTVRFDIGVEINEDESGTFAMFIGFDEDLRELAEQGGGEDLNMIEGVEDVPEGWTSEEVSEDGFEGVRISTEFESIADLESSLAELGDGADAGMSGDFLSDFGLVHEGDEFRFQVDVTDLDEQLTGAMGDDGGDDLLGGMDMSSLFEDLFEIRFRLTLPGDIKSHNADSIDGNTLTWNVSITDEGASYEAVSTVGGGSSALLYGGIAAAALVVGGVGVVAMRRRKEEAAAAAVDAAPVTTEAQPFDTIE